VALVEREDSIRPVPAASTTTEAFARPIIKSRWEAITSRASATAPASKETSV
jgi:hypothetical protein